MSTPLPRFLDGVKFTDWLKTEGVRKADLSESEVRRFWGWEQGQRADLYSNVCDGLLTRYLLMDLIPDDCWAELQSRYVRRPDRFGDARLMLAAGVSHKEVGKRLDISTRTVNRYAQRIAAEREVEQIGTR